MKSKIFKKIIILGVGVVMALGLAHAEVVFQDTFDGSGAPGAEWDLYANANANPNQSGGCLVFDHTDTLSSQAAVQTTSTVNIAAFDSVVYRFHVKDFAGSSTGIGMVAGKTSFIVAEHDSDLNALYGSSGIEGLVFTVEHNGINFGSFPDAATDPRTNIKIYTADDNTQLGTVVVQSTNDFTLVVTLTADSWSVAAEGAGMWTKSGVSSGLHGYDVSTWVEGASLRMESWNLTGTFYPASIDGVSVATVSSASPPDFQDEFEATGALGAEWDLYESGGANPSQSNGSLVFDHTEENSAQAAIQTTSTVHIADFDSVEFRYHIKDFGGSSTGIGEAGGRTSFIVAEHDSNLNALYGSSGIGGLVFAVEHRSINFGSFPDAATDPRTNIKIYKADDATEMGVVVVQSTNDFTLVVTLTADSWSVAVEGAGMWTKSGISSGLHGYDVSTWVDGASLRMESWNSAGTFYPASIDGVGITTVFSGVASPATIVGWSTFSNNVMQMVVDAPGVASLYYPKTTEDLVFGTWTNVPHSKDGLNPFVITNLAYSTAMGTNEVIYVQATNAAAFFGIGE